MAAEFDEVFTTLYGAAYRVAFTILGDRGDSEDVAQEALARAHGRWSSVGDHAEPWVVRVSANLAIDRIRKRRRGETAVHVAPSFPSDNAAIARVDLQRALAKLSRRQREAVVLRYLADLPELEVASLLGCSTGAVKQHATRGLASLRARLAEVG